MLKKITKKQLRSFVGCVCFLAILWCVFSQTTYLFRNYSGNSTRIKGIQYERQKLDMIYVGGSVIMGDWEPLMAWQDWGFTSYCLATDSIPAESLKAYVEYARKYQDTDLFLIDAKPFVYFSEEEAEAGLRNGTDSMGLLEPARYRLLRDYFSSRKVEEDTDILSYYFDIAKYHTNLERLQYPSSWLPGEERDRAAFKGFEMRERTWSLTPPEDFATEERAPLQEKAQKLLVELLEYGREENLRFLFVISPYWIEKSHQKMYNTIADTVEGYGQSFLNANAYYEEMGIDFSEDFLDVAHVNISGADKYTAFLGSYLCAHYALPDHRQDPAYDRWHVDSDAFEIWKEKTWSRHRDILAQAENGAALAEKMRDASTLPEWYGLASTDYYNLFVVSAEVEGQPDPLLDRKILEKLGLESDYSQQLRILTGETILHSNRDSGEEALEFSFLGVAELGGTVSTADGSCTLALGKQKFTGDPAGINVFVVNAYNGRVEDHRVLRFDAGDGGVRISGRVR